MSSYQECGLDCEIEFGTFSFSGSLVDSMDYGGRGFVRYLGYLGDLLILNSHVLRLVLYMAWGH